MAGRGSKSEGRELLTPLTKQTFTWQQTVMLEYHPTPTILISNAITASAGVELFVKREDLNHPIVSGNKWWKLNLNIQRAISEHYDTLLTFGGAYSNHIYATAAAARELGLKSIGVIRGEESKPLNATLQFARDAGMQLHFISRASYGKRDIELLSSLGEKFGRCYVIPEGGSNELGVEGIASFAEQLPRDFDYTCCPIGTGATVAGLIRGLRGIGVVIGFPVLKGGDAWIDTVKTFNPHYTNWTIIPDYHFGGYAKTTATLENFIREFSNATNVPLEFVYSGKMFYGILDLIAKGYFKRGSRILALHTGGLRNIA